MKNHDYDNVAFDDKDSDMMNTMAPAPQQWPTSFEEVATTDLGDHQL